MQKSNNTTIIGAVVIFGIIAVGLTIYALTSSNKAPNNNHTVSNNVADTQPATPKSYYVATRTITPRTRITRDMLQEKQGNGSAIPDNAITDPYAVIGKLANKTIHAGQTMTDSATVNPVGRVIPANIPVPAGLRAIAVWVNPKETAAGLVDVGDRVDVIVTHKLTGKTTVGDGTSFVSGRTIAQDLQVLAVDRSIHAPTGAAKGAAKPANSPKSDENQDSDSSHTRVILAASPDKAQRIAAAGQDGVIHLDIRNPSDSVTLPTGEALEYPVHLISNTSKPKSSGNDNGGGNSGNNGNNQGNAEFLRWKEQQYIKSHQSTSPAIPNVSSGNSQTSDLHEVTVIRGTQKSQVGVPQ